MKKTHIHHSSFIYQVLSLRIASGIISIYGTWLLNFCLAKVDAACDQKLQKYTNWWWSRIYKQHFGFFHQRNICKFAGQAISIYRNHTLIWGPETVGRTT